MFEIDDATYFVDQDIKSELVEETIAHVRVSKKASEFINAFGLFPKTTQKGLEARKNYFRPMLRNIVQKVAEEKMFAPDNLTINSVVKDAEKELFKNVKVADSSFDDYQSGRRVGEDEYWEGHLRETDQDIIREYGLRIGESKGDPESFADGFLEGYYDASQEE